MEEARELPVLADLLGRLVAIDSVNPDLVPGAKGESEIAAFVAGWLRDRGLEVEIQETAAQGRPNVIARTRTRGGGRTLMLNAHLDTVGAGGMRNPFRPEVLDGRLYGRGAQDTKGALAAFMMAAAQVNGEELPGQILLTAVADEEYASIGTEAVVRSLKADAAIVGEPSGLEIVTEHKGFAWFEIETSGRAAHGSRPDLGVDAIARMGRVLVALEALAGDLSRSPAHRTLGAPSVHASLIRGGQELSSYPASCRLGIERRTLPGEGVAAVERELQAVLDRLQEEDPSLQVTLHRIFSREPMEVPHDAAIVQALARQVGAVTGSRPVYAGMSGWLDSALLSAAGIPTVVFGPAGEGLHGDLEWVDLRSVDACRAVACGVIREFCR